ncbi:MAG TPA: TSUP family transporter [Flavisolibacter sp.]|jgi:siroheme synthase-like protein|nr:TSUP family transporter [Flavisolibacter sp.]
MEVVQTNKPEVVQDETENHLFPVFLKLEELRVLLVGAGNVGLEKLNALLSNSPEARVTVVSPFVSVGVEALSIAYPHVTILRKTFEVEDFDDKDLVIVAVNNKELSRLIRDAAKEKSLLVNVADTPDLCDFYLGSIVKKGSVKIAISTNGKSPTVAKRLKEVLNDAIPTEINGVLNNMQIIRSRLNGDFAAKVKKLDAITQVLIKEKELDKQPDWKKIASYILIAFGLMLFGHFVLSYVPLKEIGRASVEWAKSLDSAFAWMVLAGFLAQLVDGATSMGYGVTSAIVLMSSGVSPAAISGSIHTAEIFASGASGYSHYKFGNVNKKMFKALVIPGVIGAILGAVLLVKFGETHIAYIRPAMAVYTLFLGIKIFYNAFKKTTAKKKFKRYGWLAGAGGFLDSFGGGGWGPIVTSTLITKGRTPRFVVGSVSLTEFFVTVASAFTFFTLIGVQHWQVIVALIIGGLLAAPIAAKLSGKLPRKASFILLGTVVVIWSVRILINLL